jgi:hypothetical protein
LATRGQAARGGIDAQRSDDAHALADRHAERGMKTAAADQQDGGVVERVAFGQLGHDIAFCPERARPAEHGRVQRPQPQAGGDPGDQLIDRVVFGDRQGMG